MRTIRELLRVCPARYSLRQIIVAPDEVLLLVLDVPPDEPGADEDDPPLFVADLCSELVRMGLQDRSLILTGQGFVDATWISVKRDAIAE